MKTFDSFDDFKKWFKASGLRLTDYIEVEVEGLCYESGLDVYQSFEGGKSS